MAKLYMKSTFTLYVCVDEEKIKNIKQPVISISDFIGVGMAEKVRQMNDLLNDKGWLFKAGEITTSNIIARQGERQFSPKEK